MAISPRILKQLGHPSGITGRLVLRLLNRVNRGMNDVALKALDLGENDHVLEVGFGGGALIARVLEHDKTPRVTGAEISELAINLARKRYRNYARANFALTDGKTLPFESATFTRVACVNVIYFWPDVPEMLTEILRILADKGKLVLCYSEQSPDNVTSFFHDDVEAQLRTAGFATTHTTEHFDKDNDRHFCTVATKAAP